MADKPQFQIQMKGANLAPETVRASDLATLLTNLEGAIVETARSQDVPLAYHTDQVLVSLVRVESGNSSDLTIAVARAVSPAASILSHAVAERRFHVLPFEAQEHLHRLSLHAIQRRWSYEFHSINGLHISPAVISYEFPVPKPVAAPTTSGDSILWGYLWKSGGDPPSAILRLRNGKLFNAIVTDEIIRQMESDHLLYSDIGLIGVATWRLKDWSLVSFKATELANYRSEGAGPAETFRKLREASKGRWDNIDPEDFVRDLRSKEV